MQSDGTPPPEGTVVTVLAFPVRSPGSRSPTTIERDASIGLDGTYAGEIAVSGNGSFVVSVRPPGRAPVASEEVKLGAATEHILDVKIPAGSVVAGRVIDAGTGVAVVGAVLRSQAEGIAVAVTDVQGRFTWTCAAAKAEFDVNASGYLLGYVTWDGRGEVVVPLNRAGDIRGTVAWPDGTPVAGVEVLTQRRLSRGLSGADGTFVIRGLDAGVYRLEVGPALSTVDAQRTFLDGVRAGTRDLRIVVQPAAAISGKLVDDEGHEVAGAMILAAPTGAQEPLFRAVTSADGSFRLAGLSPSGTYAVGANGGPRPDGSIENRYAPAARMGVRAGTDDLELRFAKWLSIEGTLEDETGAPMPRVVLTAGSAVATTDERGHFRFAQLSPGTYPITAARTRDRKPPIEVRGGEAVAAGAPDVRLVGVRPKR
jgi:hypothetical protein